MVLTLKITTYIHSVTSVMSHITESHCVYYLQSKTESHEKKHHHMFTTQVTSIIRLRNR